jgi:hypothetical protein
MNTTVCGGFRWLIAETAANGAIGPPGGARRWVVAPIGAGWWRQWGWVVAPIGAGRWRQWGYKKGLFPISLQIYATIQNRQHRVLLLGFQEHFCTDPRSHGHSAYPRAHMHRDSDLRVGMSAAPGYIAVAHAAWPNVSTPVAKRRPCRVRTRIRALCSTYQFAPKSCSPWRLF